jgi:hypothetical protein
MSTSFLHIWNAWFPLYEKEISLKRINIKITSITNILIKQKWIISSKNPLFLLCNFEMFPNMDMICCMWHMFYSGKNMECNPTTLENATPCLIRPCVFDTLSFGLNCWTWKHILQTSPIHTAWILSPLRMMNSMHRCFPSSLSLVRTCFLFVSSTYKYNAFSILTKHWSYTVAVTFVV